MTTEAEKVGSATEIQRQLVAYNEGRVRRGLTPLSAATHEALVDAVMAHVYGLGELDELWINADVENIDVNGPDDVFVAFVGGQRVRWTPIASNQEELIELIRRAARRLGQNEVEFDARHPQLDLQLPDGSRLFAVFGGDAGNGLAVQPTMSIRRHRHLAVGMDDLVALGVMPAEAAEFLVAAFRAGENVIVAGDHNAGKTTCLRALCFDAIPRHRARGHGRGLHHRARPAHRRPPAQHRRPLQPAGIGRGRRRGDGGRPRAAGQPAAQPDPGDRRRDPR